MKLSELIKYNILEKDDDDLITFKIREKKMIKTN
jgi:hypothetical protein